MRRWHQELTITQRQWRKHRRSHVESNKNSQYYFGFNRIGQDPYEVDCPCDDQVGRFRKKDAFDCGNPRCGICHQDKFPKRSKTQQEKRSDVSLREQLRETTLQLKNQW